MPAIAAVPDDGGPPGPKEEGTAMNTAASRKASRSDASDRPLLSTMEGAQRPKEEKKQ
jgi:hypothetical protein